MGIWWFFFVQPDDTNRTRGMIKSSNRWQHSSSVKRSTIPEVAVVVVEHLRRYLPQLQLHLDHLETTRYGLAKCSCKSSTIIYGLLRLKRKSWILDGSRMVIATARNNSSSGSSISSNAVFVCSSLFFIVLFFGRRTDCDMNLSLSIYLSIYL